MNHSYEEIRSVALDILAGREPGIGDSNQQYGYLAQGIAQAFIRREQGPTAAAQFRSSRDIQLSQPDAYLFHEVFWDLFRQGIITLGLNDMNPQFPWFRISYFGKKLIEDQSVYFFYDVSTYTSAIQKEIPQIDPITLLYLQEAMQAFRANCILSSSVMLGVAAEHTFDLLLETIEASTTHRPTFAAVFKERLLLKRINKFKDILEEQVSTLPPEIKEDLDTYFAGILAVIRNFRNQSGHPTGKIIDREQAYVLLNLFIPYCKKMYQLREHFKTTGAAAHP